MTLTHNIGGTVNKYLKTNKFCINFKIQKINQKNCEQSFSFDFFLSVFSL